MLKLRPTTHLVILVALAVLAVGCAAGTASPSGTPSPGGSTGAPSAIPSPTTGGGGPVDATGEWRLTRGTNARAAIPIVPGADITLVVDGSTVSGRSACNTYGGQVVVKDGVVQFGDLFMTEMACAEPIMASEAAYHAALAAVRAASRDGDTLTLTGPGVELVFTKVAPPPTAELVGAPWVLDSIISGDAVSSVMGDPAELLLAADGTLTGTTGCRPFTGHYTVDGRTVTVTDWRSDPVPCPSGISPQDVAVVDVLSGGFTTAIDGQHLTVTGSGGTGLGYTTRTLEIPPAP